MSVLESLQTKSISPSSLNLYTKNLIRLNDGKEIKNLNFLKNTENILDKIKDYKPNTRRTYIISIVSLLKQEPKFKKLYDIYYKILLEYNNNLKNNNDKSDKQTENWITQEEVLDKQKELENILSVIINKKSITQEQYEKLFNLLILSLYTLNPPRRNLDYLKMNIVSKYISDIASNILPDTKGTQEGIKDNNNYIDLLNKNFIFKNYKTKKTYNEQVVPINDKLNDIIKVYLKFHPLKKEIKGKAKLTPSGKKFNVPFLVDFEGNQYNNSNDITRKLNKIFDKKIGSSMLRNIFLTDKYSDNLKELNNDAKNMGTSKNTIESNYIKTD
jgi:hypothetical protein